MSKKMLLVVFGWIFLIGIGCGEKKGSETPDSDTTTTSPDEENPKPAETNRKGKLVYKQYCVICHGADGKLAISNATDLSASTATLDVRIDQITNGKGLMTPYKDILSTEQIQSVAEYLEELRQ